MAGAGPIGRGGGTATRVRELEVKILQSMRGLCYPPQTETHAAGQLRQCALAFNLAVTVEAYPPGAPAEAQRQLVCLTGNLPFLHNGVRQGIPICVYALMYFPDHPPVIVVIPPQGLVVPPQHTCVGPNGHVKLYELEATMWQSRRLTLYSVLDHLQREFAKFPPLMYDPQIFERQALTREVEAKARARLATDTVQAKLELVSLTRTYDELRNVDNVEDATAEHVPPEIALQRLRASRHKLEDLIDVYGMRDGDIEIDEFLAYETHSNHDEKEELRAEDKALKETLDVFAEALDKHVPASGEPVVSVDLFLKVGQEIAGIQFKVREDMQRVDRAQVVIAESSTTIRQTAAGDGSGGGGLRTHSVSVRRVPTLSHAY